MSRRADGLTITRRRFIQGAGGALVLGFWIPESKVDAQSVGAWEPNAFLSIHRDGRIIVTIDSTEMGQGVNTALPQIIADELEADWEKVSVGPLPTNPSVWFRGIGTGGSRAVRTSRELLQQAGANARELLRMAAAQLWGVPVEDCTCFNSTVSNIQGKTVGYGELIEIVSTLDVPEQSPLKAESEYDLIGRGLSRKDTLIKVTGQTHYGIDTYRPGMLIASIERAPRFGARVASFDAAEALAYPGVEHVIHLPSSSWDQQEGVAVLATSYWKARKGRELLKVQWDEESGSHLSDNDIQAQLDEGMQQPGIVAGEAGGVDQILMGSDRTLTSVYQNPYVAHATLEPQNCTAHVHDGICEIWAPTQVQTASQNGAAELLGLPHDKVVVHTTQLGGGFGRRLRWDYVLDAAYLASQIDVPVRVQWSREEDIQHSNYRPINKMKLEGALDEQGNLAALKGKIVGDSPFVTYGRVNSGEYDPHHYYGFEDIPYQIPNRKFENVWLHSELPANFWRSVSFSYLLFYRESFIDEMAHLANRDPLEFRRSLLPEDSRERGVLDLLIESSPWNRPLPDGHGRGLSVGYVFESYCAMMVECSIEDGKPVIHRVDAAVDCGPPINPNIIDQQITGGIIWALTAALYGEINVENGGVLQSNFHDYPLLRQFETPEIHVHIMDSKHPTGGIGEVGVPPFAPALTNAIFAAGGPRVRRLPIRELNQNEL